MEKKTQEQLALELTELRTKHAKVREFIIPVDEDDETQTVTLFLKPMDKAARKIVEKTVKTNVEKAVYDALKYLQLGGDDLAFITSNDYAMEVANVGLAKYMSVADVIIKKKLEKYRKLLETDETAKNNALIRFYYKKDPDKMGWDKWAKSVEEINWVLRFTGQTAELKQNG